MFEGKLENQELKARLRALTEKNDLNELKEENKAIRQKLKETVESAKLTKNEVNCESIKMWV
jgi:predicted nuclease with TOPRIM domain